MKSLIVLDSPNESFTRVIEKAARTAKLEDWELTSIVEEDIGGAYGHEQRFKQKFYETIEEPIYTPTGKLSKKTRKINKPTDRLRAGIDELFGKLQSQHPNLVIACGNESFEALVGQTGVGNYRGSILPARRDTFKALAVEHPSYILLGGAKDFWVLTHDLKKAAREQEFPEIRREFFYAEADPQHELLKVLSDLQAIKQYPQIKWTLDVETRAGTLACFAISYRIPSGSEVEKLFSFCIPIQTTSGPYWSPEEELEIWRTLHATAASNPNLCNQNIEYDIYYLLRYGVEPSGVWMDTMLAHSILYPEFPKGLDFLCSFYLDDVVYYKGEGRNWGAGDRDPQLWEYCCKDAVYTLRVVEKIDQQLRERKLYEFYHGAK